MKFQPTLGITRQAENVSFSSEGESRITEERIHIAA